MICRPIGRITAFIKTHNDNPKPNRWVKPTDKSLASVKRLCQKTQHLQCTEL